MSLFLFFLISAFLGVASADEVRTALMALYNATGGQQNGWIHGTPSNVFLHFLKSQVVCGELLHLTVSGKVLLAMMVASLRSTKMLEVWLVTFQKKLAF